MIRARSEVVGTPAAVHGGPAGSADERAPVRIDFSASLNAWGPAPGVLAAIRAAPVDVYPDPECLRPRRAAAERWQRPVEEIAFGAGASELIHAACFAYLRPGDTVLVPTPTFGEYARAATLCGARVLQGIASPPRFAVEADAIAAATRQHRPKLVFLCAPNNPTGQRHTVAELTRVAEACADAEALLILDQSYDAFLKEPLGMPALPGHSATLHIRSITKDHALAGVRAAFAVGPYEVMDALQRARVPWAASTAAQAGAVAALEPESEAHVLCTVARLRFERELLEASLMRLGVSSVPSATHYLLAAVGDAHRVAGTLLQEHGIKVRDCTSFGLPEHIRVAARTPAENNELIAALEAVCCT